MVKLMKTTKKIAVFGMVFLLCFFLTGATTTQAKKDKPVINFTFVWDVIGHADRMWESCNGVWHLRDTPHDGHVVTGDSDFYGDLFLMSSLNVFDDMMALTTLNSVGWGTFSFEGNYWEEAVGFTGQINFKIHEWYMIGKFTCHGSGGFEGSLIKGTIEGWIGGTNIVQMTIMN